MYYPDLSLYPSEAEASVGGYLTLSVGWLAANQPYTRGQVPVAFVDRLWVFCCNALLYTLGYHKCPFCRGSPFGISCTAWSGKAQAWLSRNPSAGAGTV